MKNLVGLFVFWSAAALAQEVAQISGTVTDQTGAFVPGVEVTATQTDTGTKRTAVTDSGGLFAIPIFRWDLIGWKR